MPARSKQLKVEIVGDATKARKALAKLDSSLASTESTGKKMGRQLAGVLAGAGAIALGTSAIRLAGDIEKSQAAMEGLYGDAQLAQQTVDQLNEIASKSSLSFTGYLDAANTLAYAGVQGERTTKILENVGKAIVATGGSTEHLDRAGEALLKMVNSGQVFKRDLNSLSQTGVPIISGLADLLGVTIEDVNRLAREGAIGIEDVLTVMEQGSGEVFQSQIESADRVEATTAASVERLKENFMVAIGQGVMPLLEGITPIATVAGNAIAAIPSEAVTAAMGIGGAWVVWSKWGDQIQRVASTQAWDNLRLGLMGVTESGGGAMNKLGGLLGTVKTSPMIWAAGAAAAGGFVMILADMAGQSKRTQKNLQDLLDAQKSGATWQDAFNEKLLNTLHNLDGGFDLGDSANAFREAMEVTGTSATDLSDALRGTDADYRAFRDSLEADVVAQLSSGVAGRVIEDVDSMRTSFLGAKETAAEYAVEADTLGLKQEELAASTDEAGESTDVMTQILEAAKQKADEAAQEVNDLTAAVKEYADSTTLLLSGNIAVEAGLDQLIASLKENGDNWDITDEKGRTNYKTLIDVKDAMYQVAQSMIDQGEPMDVVNLKWVGMVDQLRGTMEQAGMTQDEIDLLIAQMGMTPDRIETLFVANTSEATQRARELRDVFNSLPSQVSTDVQFAMYGGGGGFFGAPPPGNAIGHRLRPGWAIVGEHGPELTDGKQVIGAGRTQALLDSMPAAAPPMVSSSLIVHVTVEGSVVAERDLALSVREQLLELQKRSSTSLLPGVVR